MLASFDRPGTSNGPTAAIYGRLEHLSGTAFGFRNLTNYTARSLLEAGGFRPDYTLVSDGPANGDEVSDRGRIAQRLQQAYDAAH